MNVKYKVLVEGDDPVTHRPIILQILADTFSHVYLMMETRLSSHAYSIDINCLVTGMQSQKCHISIGCLLLKNGHCQLM
jgi:hypothetical protein